MLKELKTKELVLQCRKEYMLILLLFSFFSSSLFAKECAHDAENFRCVEYVRNYDADTVTFNIPNLHPLIGKKVNVRVAGVDTPEIRTKNNCEKSKGKRAKDIVSKLLKNAKRIDLSKVSRGKYFRIVADVVVDGTSLSELLLKSGFAYAYDGGTKKNVDWCKPIRSVASDK